MVINIDSKMIDVMKTNISDFVNVNSGYNGSTNNSSYFLIKEHLPKTFC